MSTDIEVNTSAHRAEIAPVVYEEIIYPEAIKRYEEELAPLIPGTTEYQAKKDILDELRRIYALRSLGLSAVRNS